MHGCMKIVIFFFHIEPSQPPNSVSVNATNATSVIISWVAPLQEYRNGIIQSYTVRVVGVHTDEDFTLSINSTEIVVDNLHPFYSYEFTVAAVTTSLGPFSLPVTLAMPPAGQYNFMYKISFSGSFWSSASANWGVWGASVRFIKR